MPQKSNRPRNLDLGSTAPFSSSSSSSSSSMSSSRGYHPNGGTINYCVANDTFNLDILEERAVRGNNRGNFDEIDLVSECSTPCAYTPGKYLQLCDISPSADVSDVTLWPSSSSSIGAPLDEWDTAALVLPQKKRFEDGGPFLHSYKKHSSPSLSSSSSSPSPSSSSGRHFIKVRCLSNKYLVIIAVCLIIALSAMGSLAVFI